MGNNKRSFAIMAAESSSSPIKTGRSSTIFGKILAGWGVLGVIGILANALRRVIPIALQQKFCPLVVKRAFTLADNPGFFNWLLAGPYSMGLFNATKKRLIVSWGISIGVVGIVAAVKRLSYPWRSIIDGGVVL